MFQAIFVLVIFQLFKKKIDKAYPCNFAHRFIKGPSPLFLSRSRVPLQPAAPHPPGVHPREILVGFQWKDS